MDKNADIIKKTCKEMGLTYKELAEKIGYGEGAIKTAVSTNNVSAPMRHAIALYLRIVELESELKRANMAKEVLKKWIES